MTDEELREGYRSLITGEVVDFTVKAGSDTESLQSLATILNNAAPEANLMQQSEDFRNAMTRLTEPTMSRLRARAQNLRQIADHLDETADRLSAHFISTDEYINHLCRLEEDARQAYRMAEIKQP